MKMKNRKKYIWICMAAAGVLIVFVCCWFIRDRKEEYLFVMGDVRSFEDFPMYQNFESEVERLGGEPKVLEFEGKENSAINQIKMLDQEVTDNTVCIVVNASSNDSLSELLQQYQEEGIEVISCISEVSAESRMLHVGTVRPIRNLPLP